LSFFAFCFIFAIVFNCAIKCFFDVTLTFEMLVTKSAKTFKKEQPN